MSGIDWPDGAMYYVPDWGFYRCEHGEWWQIVCGQWQRTPYKSPENFSWFGKAIARSSPAWNGEGLPPVGAVCEALWNESRNEWFKTKVFGVNEHEQPIHRWEEGPKKFDYQASPLTGFGGKPYFRPIRTPEQIAADERESAVNGMLCYDALGGSRRGLAEALYDAGYRKQEPKP